jgi:hypothetical protein
MHAIASAIVASLRTSTAPTGSSSKQQVYAPPRVVTPVTSACCSVTQRAACKVVSSAADLRGGDLSAGRAFPLFSSDRSVVRWALLSRAASSAAGLRSGGPYAPICCKNSSSFIIRVVRSGDGLDSPGWPAQQQAYAMATRERLAAGQPVRVQSRLHAVAARTLRSRHSPIRVTVHVLHPSICMLYLVMLLHVDSDGKGQCHCLTECNLERQIQ